MDSDHAAEIAFLQEKPDEALQDAQEANRRDLTFLPAYRMLGMTSLLKGDVPAALKALELYTTYQTDDALAWRACWDRHTTSLAVISRQLRKPSTGRSS